MPLSQKPNKIKKISKESNPRRKNDIQILDYFIK
jgi:hypothetical protein